MMHCTIFRTSVEGIQGGHWGRAYFYTLNLQILTMKIYYCIPKVWGERGSDDELWSKVEMRSFSYKMLWL